MRRPLLVPLATLAAAVLLGLGGLALPFTTPVAGAQPTSPDPTAAPSPTVTIVEETTTSAVVDNRDLGRIIKRPNSGKAPESPGDPGGWLQVSLFFLICGIVVLMAVGVWWRSRRLRDRRLAAGADPVTLARARGEGTRSTPTGPPTPVD